MWKCLYLIQKHITTPIPKFYWSELLFHEKNILDSGAKTLIEFGAGKTLIQNIYLSATGIKQIVVDVHKVIDCDLVNKARR